jgi:hypothetical protein
MHHHGHAVDSDKREGMDAVTTAVETRVQAAADARVRRRRDLRPLLALPAALWLLAFAVAPLVMLLVMSFWTSTIFWSCPSGPRPSSGSAAS